MTAIGFPSRVLVKKGNEKHRGHCSVCFFALWNEKKKRPTHTKKTKIGKRDERKCSYEFCCGSIV